MHEGHYSALLGLTGVPAEAEEVVVARDVALARLTGGRLHVTHLSSAGSVDLVAAARARGIRVTADVTPHHLALLDEDLVNYDTNLRVNPPLRSSEHRDALRSALAAGTIDAVATDHAPHAPEEKEQEFDQAPPGTIGLETALAVVLTEMVEPGLLSLPEAIDRLSTAPARILGLPDQGGPIAPGASANLVLFDPAAEWTVGDRPFRSMADNSAFLGRDASGAGRAHDAAGRVHGPGRRARQMTRAEALLVLEDGTAFRGRSFGAAGETFGEAVFNTGMCGYQEVLTDPSYRRQIVTMTAPHQGNYGVNPEDAESDRVQVAGFVVREAVGPGVVVAGAGNAGRVSARRRRRGDRGRRHAGTDASDPDARRDAGGRVDR